MFPILLSIGPVTIYTFSLFLILAFLAMGFWFWRKGKEEHYEEDELFDGYLMSLVWAVVLSRVAFVLLHFQHFGFNLGRWLDVFSSPGLEPFVGVLMGFWSMFQFGRKKRWDVFEILDFAAIAVAGGMAITWLGAFFDGSNFGKVTTLPWGMTFPGIFDKRHPLQLYGFGAYLLLFGYLSWVEGKYRTFEWYRNTRHSAQTGFVFAAFCIIYGLVGLGFSFLTASPLKAGEVLIEPMVRVLVLLFGVAVLYVRSGRSFLPAKR